MKVRGWKKVFHANGNLKKAGVAILISEKINIKIKTVTRDKERQYIIIKGPIQGKDTIVNIYALSRRTQYVGQILTAIKREINGNAIIMRGFNNPLTSNYNDPTRKSIGNIGRGPKMAKE